MKYEKSCGAVVIRRNGTEVEYLIEWMAAGHYSLPKGHVENNETELETATREIKEETNLDVIFFSGFRETIVYCPAKDIEKEVVFFVAETSNIEHLKVQEEEVKEVLWLPYEKAKEILTHDSDKSILAKAYSFIEGYGY